MSFADIIPTMALCLYFIQAVIMLSQGQYGFSLMWGSYALANVGLIMAQKAGQ